MPRKETEAVPEGSGIVPRQEEFRPDQPTLVGVYRRFEEIFERRLKGAKSHLDKMDVFSDKLRGTRKRLADPEQDAWQPRLAMEADGPSDTKTRKRTYGAAQAEQAMRGDSFSANRVDPDPMCSTSFGVKVEPPAVPCRDDVLVENGAPAPNSCRSPLEMRSPTAAGGLVPAGEASTTTRITFYEPRLRFCPTEETHSERMSTQYALYYNINFRLNQLRAPSWRRVIQTKSRQNLIFDPGGSKSRLRACLLLGTWRALLCGEVLVLERLVTICSICLAGRMTRELSCRTEGGPRNIIFRSKIDTARTYCGRPLFLRSQAGLKGPYR